MTTKWTGANKALAAAAESLSLDGMRAALAAGASARYLAPQRDDSLRSMAVEVVSDNFRYDGTSRFDFGDQRLAHSERQAAALRLLAAHGGLDAALAIEALCHYWAHHACYPAVVAVLLEAGADVHTRDHQGRTALHCVWRADVARMLIAAGAAVNAVALPAAHCRTPLGSVVAHSWHGIRASGALLVATLIAAGADVDAVDIQGRSCLKACMEWNDFLAPRLLRAPAEGG